MKGSMVLTILILLASCSDKPGRGGILEEKKMTNVMWDLMRVDEFATTFVSKDSSLDLHKERFRLYADVYRINGIDEKTFSKSYKYYAAHPDQMKQLFDSLTTKGEHERQLLYQPADTSAAKKFVVTDSLKRDSLKSAFLFRDSIHIDSMKRVTRTQNILEKKRAARDSLRNKKRSLKKAPGKKPLKKIAPGE
ncbi:MAG: DUF4296 domain-containing protein [Chitinophagaceae bacterium]